MPIPGMSCADPEGETFGAGPDPEGDLTDTDGVGLSVRVQVQSVIVKLDNEDISDGTTVSGVAPAARPLLFRVGQTNVHLRASDKAPDQTLLVRGGAETLDWMVLEQRLLKGSCRLVDASKAHAGVHPECCLAFRAQRVGGR